jgi:hypothetical protein
MSFENTLADVQRPISELRAEMERLVAPLREQIKQAIKDGMANAVITFFNQFPQVKTIYWQQYVPYFNDGDECVFTMNDVNFSPADHKEIDSPHWGSEQDDDEKADFSSWDKDTDPAFRQGMQDFTAFLNGIEDFLEERYGTNAFIKLHRDGDWSEEYEPPY